MRTHCFHAQQTRQRRIVQAIHSTLFHNLQFEHIDYIHVRTAEQHRAVFLRRKRSSVAQNINVRKCHMHRHRAQLAAFRIKVKGITNFMPVMTATCSLLIHQCDPNFWFHHMKHLFQQYFMVTIICDPSSKRRCTNHTNIISRRNDLINNKRIAPHAQKVPPL